MPAACGQGERTDICPSKRRRIQRNSTLSTWTPLRRRNVPKSLAGRPFQQISFGKDHFCLEWQKSIGLNSMSFSSGQETIM